MGAVGVAYIAMPAATRTKQWPVPFRGRSVGARAFQASGRCSGGNEAGPVPRREIGGHSQSGEDAEGRREEDRISKEEFMIPRFQRRPLTGLGAALALGASLSAIAPPTIKFTD